MYQVVRKLFFTECRCAEESSKTYEELFAKLDTNKDGKVDVSELKAGLAAMGIQTGKAAAQVESWIQDFLYPYKVTNVYTDSSALIGRQKVTNIVLFCIPEGLRRLKAS